MQLSGTSQHGFTKRKSCFTNLISVSNKLTHLVDEWKVVNVIYLDFHKAFDTVLHITFLYELSSYGMSRFMVCSMRNWLKSRAPGVAGNGATSHCCDWSLSSI